MGVYERQSAADRLIGIIRWIELVINEPFHGVGVVDRCPCCLCVRCRIAVSGLSLKIR